MDFEKKQKNPVAVHIDGLQFDISVYVCSVADVRSASFTHPVQQLSKSNEFYPGTLESQDRILLISGTVDQLLTALHLVLGRLRAEPIALRAVQARTDDDERIVLRMLVHTRLCGTLIGKGGATIRSFNEDSNAVFNISAPPTMPGLTERIVKITGNVEQLMRAVALVVTKLSENPDYHLLTDANLSYSQRFLAPHAPQNSSYMAISPGNAHSGTSGISMGAAVGGTAASIHATTVTLAVPEDRVGSVIGKGGSVINQIKGLVNVDIRISKKGEHLPGTTDRACQISGSPEAVDLAQRLILQRIEKPPRV